MRSGTKNCLVSIERYTETADPETNAPVNVWAVWKTAWAFAEPKRGREVAVNNQIVSKTYMRFRFDYLDITGIDSKDVLVVEGIRWQIEGLLPDLATKDEYTVDAVFQPTQTGRT